MQGTTALWMQLLVITTELLVSKMILSLQAMAFVADGNILSTQTAWSEKNHEQIKCNNF